jgi:glycosyltransferase involved in cell wall biosynthesis
MRLFGLLSGEASIPRAVNIYRVTLPFGYITKFTRHSAAYDSSDNVQSYKKDKVKYLLGSDIIVINRSVNTSHQNVVDYIRLLKSKGAIVVYETDDDLTERYRDISFGKHATCEPYLFNCDAVTVTTDHLKSLVQQYTDKPCFVLPNSIEIKYWNAVCDIYERKEVGFNVMLVGTPTHGDDWRLANDAMQAILDEYRDVQLLVAGFNPAYIEDRDRVKRLPFIEYVGYPTRMKEADIVLCAIDPDDVFNHSKSAVKAMEAWAAKRKLDNGEYGGAAVIATDSNVYRGTVTDGYDGLLVKHSVEGYYDAIKRLLDDGLLRQKLQKNGHRTVAKRHSITNNYKLWVSAYTQMLRSLQ